MKKFIVLALVLLSFSTIFADWKKDLGTALNATNELLYCTQNGFYSVGQASSHDDCRAMCERKGYSEACSARQNGLLCYCK